MATLGRTEVSLSPNAAIEGQENEFELFAREFVTNILPYGVVFGSLLLKIPQIAKVLWHRSAEGISFTSVCFEVTSSVIATSWGIAQALRFKDYGESMIILGEVALLLLLVGYLQKNFFYALSVLFIETLALFYMSSGLLHRDLHEWLLSLQIFFGLSSRVPQILMNYRNLSTGHLSFVSFYLAMMGGISRLLTTFHNVPVEKGKYVMLMQAGVSVGLNVAVLLQILMYRRRTEEKLKQEKSRVQLTEDKKRQ